MERNCELIICYVTDRQSLQVAPEQNRESALARRIEDAVRAGVDWVQIREKDLPTREMVDLTRTAILVCQSTSPQNKTRILVNDRLDVARVAGAAGIHVGEKSLPVRALVDERLTSGRSCFLVGASCHSLDGAIHAAEEGADYLYFGPVFETPSKASFGPAQGLTKLADICHIVSVPVIAIGGIGVENARACREAGAAGVAAIRLFQGNDALAQIVANLRTK